MLFDSHAHINNDTLTEEARAKMIAEIAASDLAYVMDVGFDLPSSRQAVADAAQLPWCYAAVGVHPHDTDTMDEEGLAEIRRLADAPKVRAIGEIGLDFHYENSDRAAQIYWFRRQIRLANALRMPIVIHSREADQLTMDILREEDAFSPQRCDWFPRRIGAFGEAERDARVLLHCYSGSLEMARQYVKLGATISIAGPVTYKNNRKTCEVAREIPLCYLLVETDSPYLAPVPHRGKPNTPPYVAYTAQKIAELKEIPVETVAEQTLRNAKTFFGIA